MSLYDASMAEVPPGHLPLRSGAGSPGTPTEAPINGDASSDGMRWLAYTLASVGIKGLHLKGGRHSSAMGDGCASSAKRREWATAAHPSLSRVASADRAPVRKGYILSVLFMGSWTWQRGGSEGAAEGRRGMGRRRGARQRGWLGFPSVVFFPRANASWVSWTCFFSMR
jgi:hypothetical protein